MTFRIENTNIRFIRAAGNSSSNWQVLLNGRQIAIVAMTSEPTESLARHFYIRMTH